MLSSRRSLGKPLSPGLLALVLQEINSSGGVKGRLLQYIFDTSPTSR